MAPCGRLAAGSSALCKAASSMTFMRQLAAMLQASPHQAASLATDACSGIEPVEQATPLNPSLCWSPTAGSCISPVDRRLSRSVGAPCRTISAHGASFVQMHFIDAAWLGQTAGAACEKTPLLAEGQQASSHHLSARAACRAAHADSLRRHTARQTLHRVNRRRSSRGSSRSRKGGAAGGPRAAAAPASHLSSPGRLTSLAPWPRNGAHATMPLFWHDAIVMA